MKRSYLLASILLLLCTVCGCGKQASDAGQPAKYIFLFIGDGMGQAHVYTTESYLAYKAGELNVVADANYPLDIAPDFPPELLEHCTFQLGNSVSVLMPGDDSL